MNATYPDQETGPDAAALTWSRIVTDDGWGCPTAADAAALSKGAKPTYLYLFADENAPNTQGYVAPKGFPLRAGHGLELSYLFGAGPKPQDQKNLSNTMIGYWTSFAHTGNPNGPGRPNWQSFQNGGLAQGLSPATVAPVNTNDIHHCAFWTSINS